MPKIVRLKKRRSCFTLSREAEKMLDRYAKLYSFNGLILSKSLLLESLILDLEKRKEDLLIEDHNKQKYSLEFVKK